MPTFLSPIDLLQNELRNARVQNLGSAPSTPVGGQVYFDSTLHKLRWWNDFTTAWVNAEGTAGAVTNVTATAPIVSSGGATPNLTLNLLVNADISGSAAIAYSKLALTGAILNADLAGSIAYSKLNLTGAILNADLAGSIAYSKLSLSNSIVNADIAAGAAIVYSKLNLGSSIVNADIAGGAAIVYSKLNLTGAIVNGDLAGSIAYSKLSAPIATVSMGSQIVSNVAAPSTGTDAANKTYVDSVASGLDVKASVRAVATAPITLSGTQTIDSVALIAGDRVLVTAQASAPTNGIYVVAAGAWSRSTDADTSAEVTSGMFTFVTEGGTYGDSGWVLTTNDPIVLGTDPLAFAQFSGAGQITAGAGLTKSGNTIDAVGTTNRITVAADSIDISTSYVGQATITTLGTVGTGVWQGTAVATGFGGTGAGTVAGAKTNLGFMGRYATAIGDGVATSYVVNHALGTRDVTVQIWRASAPFDKVEADVSAPTDANNVTVAFSVAPTSNQYRVVVVG